MDARIMKNCLKCQETRAEILSGERLTAGVQEHLLACGECRCFSSAYVVACGRREMPPRLDAAVKRCFLRKASPGFRWRWVASAAAVVVLLSGGVAAELLHRGRAECVWQKNIAEESWMIGRMEEEQNLSDLETLLAATVEIN